MSAIGGIFSFTDRPINEQTLTLLGKALSVRGPDSEREVCTNSVGMTYCAFHTNPESHLEVQPLVSHRRQILAWDGRLDNREELLTLLRSEPGDCHTDVAIVMAAYIKWGVAFLPRLIGDFALSLWDPTMRMLLLARDPVGTRTLFYHVSEERIIWSSELAPLLDLAGIELEPNDTYIAGYFTHGPEPKLTPYKNIYAVPPGNVISISEGQLQQQRFWGLDRNHEIRYKNDGDYEQHFLHLFREAVRCRLRADRPVWSELSGGLDSSSIVCIADQIIKSGEVQIPPLETVSHVYDESLSCDESKFIQYVEEHRGKTGHHLPESTYRVLAPFADEASVVIPNIVHIGADYHLGLCETMRENGARILLTGQGGDQLLCSAPNPTPELADLLFQRKPLQLHRRLQEWSHALKRPYVELLWKNAVLATMPVKIQALFQRGGPCSLPEWIDQNFARRMNLYERMLGGMDIFGFQTPSGRDQSAGFLSVVRLISAGYRRERTDIEISYPYLHRPLVEFLQAIPHEQRIRPGETRSLMRRALRNVLPDEIARRKSKGRPTEAILRAVIREWPRLQLLFENARVSDYGYVNSQKLLLSLSLARTGNKNAITLVNRVIALEFWLRSLEGRRSGAKKGATVTREHAFPITAAQTGAVAVAAH